MSVTQMTVWRVLIPLAAVLFVYPPQHGVYCFKSYPLPAFSDTAVHDFPLQRYNDKREQKMCHQECIADKKCKSFTFSKDKTECITFGVGYSVPVNTLVPVESETGKQLYMLCEESESFGSACTEDSDCDFCNPSCDDGTCRCAIGFSYDVTTGDCVLECEKWGDFFSTYSEKGIIWCNRKTTYVNTPTECMENCIQQTSFDCINAEYQQSTGKCNMCDHGWYDIDPYDLELKVEGWVLLYRHCAYSVETVNEK